jgi:hypothetical protein
MPKKFHFTTDNYKNKSTKINSNKLQRKKKEKGGGEQSLYRSRQAPRVQGG